MFLAAAVTSTTKGRRDSELKVTSWQVSPLIPVWDVRIVESSANFNLSIVELSTLKVSP